MRKAITRKNQKGEIGRLKKFISQLKEKNPDITFVKGGERMAVVLTDVEDDEALRMLNLPMNCHKVAEPEGDCLAVEYKGYPFTILTKNCI